MIRHNSIPMEFSYKYFRKDLTFNCIHIYSLWHLFVFCHFTRIYIESFFFKWLNNTQIPCILYILIILFLLHFILKRRNYVLLLNCFFFTTNLSWIKLWPCPPETICKVSKSNWTLDCRETKQQQYTLKVGW